MIRPMPTTRYVIVCEGESEWTYLQQLQGFLDIQELPPDTPFETPLRFISSKRLIVQGGSFRQMKTRYNRERQDNKNCLIEIWADFDLYHRNDQNCADHYKTKHNGIPDFHFSFHNFEDFYALHFDSVALEGWLQFGGLAGTRHFSTPLHSKAYLPEIQSIFPNYKKNSLPTGFVSWESLKNLKANLRQQPKTNPHNLQGVQSFAKFLIEQINQAYPGKLD